MAIGLASIPKIDDDPAVVEVETEEDMECNLVRALGHLKASFGQNNDPSNVLHRTLSLNPSTDKMLNFFSDAFYGSKKNSSNLVVFSSNHIRSFTDDFNVTKRIGATQFGELYRGAIQLSMQSKIVAVKIWTDESEHLADLRCPYIFVKDEVMFLKDEIIASHPYLVNVIGTCCEENVKAIVYDLDPLDTLHNLMMRDDFSWLQRINVALKLAYLLEFLHKQEKPYVVLNLDPLHIMLDHMFNPILCDFGLLSGGVMGPISFIKKLVWPPIGYTDPFYISGGDVGPSCDVYGYGVILIGIIAKKVIEKEDLIMERVPPLDRWAEEEYKTNCSLVHRSLELEIGYCASDAASLSDLCMRCVNFRAVERPTMGKVVNDLMQLEVVKSHLQS